MNEPFDDGPATKPKTEPETEPNSDRELKTKPEAEPERKPEEARAVDPDSDTKVTITSGGNRFSVDKATKAGEFENTKTTGSYDANDQTRQVRQKDGSATFDTYHRGGNAKFKAKNKTITVTVKRAGDIKTLATVQERKGGGKSEFHVKFTPDHQRVRCAAGAGPLSARHGDGSSVFRHTHPSGHLGL